MPRRVLQFLWKVLYRILRNLEYANILEYYMVNTMPELMAQIYF